MESRKSLEYTCPSHGGWGMVRTGMLIPESHQLFVCPSACGRHGALGALKQGFKKRLSYLYLDESDVISGYDDAIYDAVEELLNRLPKKPKVLLVFVSCLDDLIGTDCDAVIDELSNRYPEVRFRMAHMNPISGDSDEPPAVSIWKNIYSLMERDSEIKNPGINMLGNFVPIDRKSEIHELLQLLGMKLYHIGNCSTYEELKDMGNNCLNLLTAPNVTRAAEQLKNTQGMEYLKAHVSYRPEDIKENYKNLLDKLKAMEMITDDKEIAANAERLLAEAEAKAMKAIRKAKEIIQDKKIYVDYSACTNPFMAARFLCEQGFAVERVYAKELDEAEEAYQWIKKETNIQIIKVNKHDIVHKWKEKDDSISIGMEAAYVSGSKHVVPVFQDEKMYGFYGVCLLMEQLIHCIQEETDLEQVIRQAGLVV